MGGFGGFRASCRVMRFNVVNLETKRQSMVVQLFNKLPLRGSQNDSTILRIDPGCWGDPKIAKICMVVGADVLFITAFESIDSKFN